MTRNKLHLFVGLFFLFIAVLVSGCAALSSKKLNQVNGIQEKETEVARSEFILGAGDTIDITVYREKTPEFIIGIGDTITVDVSRTETSEFILGAGDTIDIDVYRHSDLNRSVRLDTSGTITFPLIGRVQAAGKTVAEVRVEMQERLSKYLVNPQVTIEVSSRRALSIEELSKSFAVTAQKAGKIIFPSIGEIQAAGKTVLELRDEIQQELSKYFLNPQVSIDISPIQSLKIDDLSLSSRIDPTGTMMFPLIGEVQVAGKGVGQLRDEIEERLAKYLVNPQVSINVSAVQSQKVHIFGEVNSPGSFAMDRKILIWEGILKAGGFTDDANEKKVLLVRTEKGIAKVNALNLDIREMVKDGKLDQNAYLKNGDIIYVPPSFIANVEEFMIRFNNIINPFVTVERGIILAPEAIDVLSGKEEERVITISP